MNREKQLSSLYEKIIRRERISTDEAAILWHHAPLAVLGELAAARKKAVSGDKLFFNRNFHIEPTNICVFNCEFCSYRKAAGSPAAWNYSIEEILSQAQEKASSGATEVHIVGGVHPEHDLHYYAEMIRSIKHLLPHITVKAFTAIELAYMIEKAGVSYREGLLMLQEAGMASIPGGGAEIFEEELRSKLCPEKGSSAQWLSLHREAHRMGIRSNATMLYGHIETIEHRIDHLDRLRNLQDETGGFDAFIPLKYRNAGNRLGTSTKETAITEDMRTLAMSRLFLDNIPHIKAYWVMYGKQAAEIALAFGTDDIDGTIENSTRIYSMAGAEEQSPVMTTEEIGLMAAAAGLRAVERDTFYNEI